MFPSSFPCFHPEYQTYHLSPPLPSYPSLGPHCFEVVLIRSPGFPEDAAHNFTTLYLVLLGTKQLSTCWPVLHISFQLCSKRLYQWASSPTCSHGSRKGHYLRPCLSASISTQLIGTSLSLPCSANWAPTPRFRPGDGDGFWLSVNLWDYTISCAFFQLLCKVLKLSRVEVPPVSFKDPRHSGTEIEAYLLMSLPMQHDV